MLVCVCTVQIIVQTTSGYEITTSSANKHKKHLKNVGPIRHCEPPHAALPFTRCRYCRVARRLRISVHNNDDNDDNAWQRGPLWPHRMGPISHVHFVIHARD